VLVVAKDDRAHERLSRQFASHQIERLYVALAVHLRGPGLAESGRIDTAYGRDRRFGSRFSGRAGERRAVTHYRVTDRFADGALRVECRLETGRTHQIRVHLAEAGVPVLGDAVYGGRVMRSLAIIGRQALHARVLGFDHPITGERLRFEGAYPDDFRRAEETLRRGGAWR
jgi:23S rRNA pseudouridine1911/1915/1917 synthase